MTDRDAPEIVQIKITLLDVEPPVWRRVRIPADFSLGRLHDVIQAAMGWEDSHLHQFEIGERFFGQPEPDSGTGFEPPTHDERSLRLGELVEQGRGRFLYVYDFGDGWEHDIEIEAILEPEAGVAYPLLIDGARRCPPEDCGGAPGFEAFLEAMADEDHPEHEDMLDWYGAPFDADDMEPKTVQARLARIAARRGQGPKKNRKRS